MHEIEIDEKNVVRIYGKENIYPSIIQPTRPDGEPWANADEAMAWAETEKVRMDENERLAEEQLAAYNAEIERILAEQAAAEPVTEPAAPVEDPATPTE